MHLLSHECFSRPITQQQLNTLRQVYNVKKSRKSVRIGRKMI